MRCIIISNFNKFYSFSTTNCVCVCMCVCACVCVCACACVAVYTWLLWRHANLSSSKIVFYPRHFYSKLSLHSSCCYELSKTHKCLEVFIKFLIDHTASQVYLRCIFINVDSLNVSFANVLIDVMTTLWGQSIHYFSSDSFYFSLEFIFKDLFLTISKYLLLQQYLLC